MRPANLACVAAEAPAISAKALGNRDNRYRSSGSTVGRAYLRAVFGEAALGPLRPKPAASTYFTSSGQGPNIGTRQPLCHLHDREGGF